MRWNQTRVFSSKYRGVCKICNGEIRRGNLIKWLSGFGAWHESCSWLDQVDESTGKTYRELAREWDETEGKDRLTACDRIDQMMNNPEYKDLSIEAIEDYAMEDAFMNRNPWLEP